MIVPREIFQAWVHIEYQLTDQHDLTVLALNSHIHNFLICQSQRHLKTESVVLSYSYARNLVGKHHVTVMYNFICRGY